MRFIVLACLLWVGADCGAGSLSVRIEKSQTRTSASSFDEDHLDIVLREGAQVLDRQYLYSSYGLAQSQLVTDAVGARYVIVRHGEGRGTHVRTEFVTVFRLGKRLNELSRFPVSGPAGDSADWRYDYRLGRPKSGGLKFALTLKVTGSRVLFVPEFQSRIVEVK